MKLSRIILFILSLSVLSLQACSKQNRNYDEDMVDVAYEMVKVDMADEAAADYHADMLYAPDTKSSIRFVPPQIDHGSNFIPTKAASGENDGDKKFIRSANLRFEVVDVLLATHAIEDIIIKRKGFIIHSTIENKSLSLEETLVTKDSILITLKSRLDGNLSLRVHNTLLDATLREIAPLAKYIQCRNVSAEEATFSIIANKLEQVRNKDKSNRIKSILGSGKGYKLEDLLAAEEAIDESRTNADAAQVAEYELMDNIAYSTITIALWQAPVKTIEMKLKETDIESYAPGFFSKMGYAIAMGWNDVADFVTELIAIWPALLIVGAIVYGVVYLVKRRKRNKTKEEE